MEDIISELQQNQGEKLFVCLDTISNITVYATIESYSIMVYDTVFMISGENNEEYQFTTNGWVFDEEEYEWCYQDEYVTCSIGIV